jgi:creatinine amidohydrolase
VLLKLALWQDVHAYLERRADVVIPVGATEQHGPNGPLGSDLILAEELSAALGEERYTAVAPAIPYGASSLHAAFPGTLWLQPSTLLAVLLDAAKALARQGFRRFLFVNASHGSKPVVEAACTQLQVELTDTRAAAVSWWELPEVRALVLEMFGAREGHHATPGELSIVRRFYPRAVLDLPPPAHFTALPQLVAYGPDDFRSRFPEGHAGSDPSLASGDSGDRLFTAAIRGLIEAHRRLVEDP